MRRIAVYVLASALLGALIGALASVFTAEISVENLAISAIVGLVIGVIFGLRVAFHRRPPAADASLGDQERARRDKLIGEFELAERGESGMRPGNHR